MTVYDIAAERRKAERDFAEALDCLLVEPDSLAYRQRIAELMRQHADGLLGKQNQFDGLKLPHGWKLVGYGPPKQGEFILINGRADEWTVGTPLGWHVILEKGE